MNYKNLPKSYFIWRFTIKLKNHTFRDSRWAVDNDLQDSLRNVGVRNSFSWHKFFTSSSFVSWFLPSWIWKTSIFEVAALLQASEQSREVFPFYSSYFVNKKFKQSYLVLWIEIARLIKRVIFFKPISLKFLKNMSYIQFSKCL